MVTISSKEDINVVLNALGELPLKVAYKTFHGIVEQLNQQQVPVQQPQQPEQPPAA